MSPPNLPDHEAEELWSQALYPPTVARRTFLGAVSGVIVLCAASCSHAQGGRRGDGGGGDASRDNLASWLNIAEDGTITAYTGKVEIGQNIRTTLAQVVAEELRVPHAAVTMVMGDTQLCPYDAGTFGSQTTPRMVPILRRAAASGRELLLGLAADEWQVDRATLTIADGKVRGAGHEATFAELTRGKTLVQTIGEPAETPPARWNVAGTSVKKVDGPAVVTGRHLFPSDITRPGILYGKVLRPPGMGARLKSVVTSSAAAMAGVVVVHDGEFVGVAAPSEFLAGQAIAAIQAEWEPASGPSNQDLWRILRPEPRWELADVPADVRLSQTYTVAYIAHTPLEPRAAVAEWSQDGALAVWTGTQRPFGVREELSRTFGLPTERVHVEMPDMGSGYGGKHTGECAIEAVRLARGAGKPVKLVWTREEEFQWAYFRPAGVIDVSGGVTRDGRLVVWEHHNYNSGGAGVDTHYDVAQKKCEFHRADSPLRIGSYRGLAGPANFFARETMMDELAAELKQDPLAFRLANSAGAPRLQGVFRAAAEKFGWGTTKPAAGHGYGLGGGFEKGSYVATCAEVAVEDGHVRVVRVVTAFDCGKIINPDTVVNQIEGMQMMGLGGALFERIEFADGVIQNRFLSRYRVPRFSDMPQIEVVLLDRNDLGSAGAGETPMMGLAPAVGNAIFMATGQRLRALPLVLPGSPEA